LWRLSARLAPELLERSVELYREQESLSGEAEALGIAAGKSLGFEEARAREGIGRCLLAAGRVSAVLSTAGRAALADGTAGQ
jgi:hypothetical protein